jgi:hypothetical protein
MGRTPTTTATGTTDTPEPRAPEVLASGDLANIVTLELVEMISEAEKRYEAASMGRKMAATLAACRGLVRDLRALHWLPALDWRTGLPIGEPVGSDNGATPEAAEVTS